MLTQVPILSVSLDPPLQRRHLTETIQNTSKLDLSPLSAYITNYIKSKLSLPRFKGLCDYDLHDLRDHVTV